MDTTYTILWWLTIFSLGILSFPLSYKLFPRFLDKGYGLTKTISIGLVCLIVFFISSFKIAPFTFPTIFLAITVLAFFSVYTSLNNKRLLFESIKNSWRSILIEEALFAFGLFFWAYIRGYQPDIIGLEKFMDFGFVNAILRAEYLPPHDIWFSGGYINYYWFGHFVTAVLTKLTNIPSTVTYNLMIATIMGLTLTNVFSVVSSLTSLTKTHRRAALMAGLLSAFLVTFGGNFHTHFFYARKSLHELQCSDNIKDCDTNVVKEYWYPDATRFIGYDPDIDDKTIHEFPLYSFVVADLHAHLNNLPFVILYIAFLARFVVSKKDSWSELTNAIAPLGILIGAFFMTNTWDVANYLLLTAIVYTYTHLETIAKSAQKRKLLKELIHFVMRGIYILIIISGLALTVSYPFSRHFISIAEGVDFVNSHTPLWQLSVLWGYPLLLFVLFLFSYLSKKTKNNYSTADFFVYSLFTTGFILILLPEIIYVKDIYIASHHRANTMFKLTYQAFVMMYLTSGYVAIRLLSSLKRWSIKIPIMFFIAALFASLLYYPYEAISSYYGNLKAYKGLEGDMWFKTRYPNEYAITEWFNATVKGAPVIVEASGDSYTDYNVISAYTGLPTVIGWFVHEWLWRGDAAIPQERVTDIELLYQTNDIEVAQNIIDKYSIEYIIIGTLEKQKYPNIQSEKFSYLGETVFSSRSSKVLRTQYHSSF